MAFFTVETILKMALDLGLGISIKLLCDNGRIHWRDLVNDFLFWLPGVEQLGSDGLTRQIAAMDLPREVGTVQNPLAAK
jgi:hypothetical protein